MNEGIETPPAPATTASATTTATKPRKRFVGTSTPRTSTPTSTSTPGSSKAPIRRVANQVPDDILHDVQLNQAIQALPKAYNFEIHKTIHHIRRDGFKTIALQMPEGLMMYGCTIADIIERFTGALPLLLADVTYGACCIDDFTAKEMGAEMIVHYGHSCLIPVSQTSLKTLYIFVEIAIDTPHLASSVRRNFPSSRKAFRRAVLGAEQAEPGCRVQIALDEDEEEQKRGGSASSITNTNTNTKAGLEEGGAEPDHLKDITRLALVSTIQFVAAIQALRTALETALPDLEKEDAAADEVDREDMLAKMRKGDIGVWRGKYDITIPQSRPLSPGEVLGCTAPKLPDVDALIYVGDGRFHLESIMIANPTVPAFRYDPYSKKFTRETYEHDEMRTVRGEAVRAARKGLIGSSAGSDDGGAGKWAVTMGTLGRQGSLSVLKTTLPSSTEPPFMLLLSELSPQKLALFPEDEISTFIQTSCPRLSIDWGYAFPRPLLSPYEASVAMGKIKGWGGLQLQDKAGARDDGHGDYPMDFYADASLGPWTPRHRPPKVAVTA